MIILASNSPRRRQLLESSGVKFDIIPPNINEQEYNQLQYTPSEYVLMLSKLKAEDILKDNPNSIVIGADTIVVMGNKLIGKPKDEEDAYKILKSLSGKTHQIYTGVSIVSKDKKYDFVDSSELSFNVFPDEYINDYIKSKEPLDKAGAYGIQSIKSEYIASVKGDIHSIMGLPLKKVLEGLKEFGITI